MKSELGHKHAHGWQIFSREVGGRVMYHMIHATDHDEGPRLMNRAYLNALKRREPIEPLQKDLAEIWGNTDSCDKPNSFPVRRAHHRLCRSVIRDRGERSHPG